MSGLTAVPGKAACYGERGSRGLEGKERASKGTEVHRRRRGSREEQERDRSEWRSSAWKRELGTGRRGQQHEDPKPPGTCPEITEWKKDIKI